VRSVLYYVHHQGLGHWRRALAVTAHLSRPVIFASSAPPPQPLPASARFRLLPNDFPAPAEAGADAHGRLHWAPSRHDGLLGRHHLLLAEAARHRPLLAVVDVSVEVTVLLRTSGIPVIAVRQPGRRDDDAHTLGFALADEVVMPVPEEWGLHAGLARTTAVGLVGAGAPAGVGSAEFETAGFGSAGFGSAGFETAEFETAEFETAGFGSAEFETAEFETAGFGSAGFGSAGLRSAAAVGAPDRPRVLIVVGQGGSRLDAHQCALIAADLPDHPVRVLGLPLRPNRPSGPGNLTFVGRVNDPRAELAAADVVIGNAGLGTVSDVVGAGRAFVAVPEDRPFEEQHATGRALAAHRQAVVLTDLPAAGGWRTAVAQAIARGPADLTVDGAARFAELIEVRAAAGEGSSSVPVVRHAIPAPAREAVPR